MKSFTLDQHVPGLAVAGSSSDLLRWSWSTPALAALDQAADLLLIQRNFEKALEVCQCGLDSFGTELEENGSSACASSIRSCDVKSSFCIIGIQALAELNHWEEVLEWVLKLYVNPDKIPAKILQMCIILYGKVEEPGSMLEAVGSWLKSSVNQSSPACTVVVEMYLLHVLLPLGLYKESEEVVQATVSLTEDQQQAALRLIALRRDEQVQEEESSHVPDNNSLVQIDCSQQTCRGFAAKKLLSVLKVLQRVLGLSWRFLHAISLRKLLLAACVLYLLIFRLDPASPAAVPWISNLLRSRSMWTSTLTWHNRIAK
eukprot:gi/632988568/ref/XP_007883184.1/ PREDICTED: peroxisome assembly protein 26 [Callorhinchus milii]